MNNKEMIGLFLILVVAIFFRFNQLNRVPPSPSLDEVSIGWNAYSILQTGADEYGYKFPILLRAYDDWRPALYVYLAIPFVKFFGLSALSVRLPSVLLSLVTILATYFLVKELFSAISPRRSAFAHRPRCLAPPLIASFLLAISPWHIYLSRLGHEVNAGLTFSVLGILFFLKAVNAQRKRLLFLILAAIFWALSFYTYQSLKIFGPLMILALGVIYRERLLAFKKETVLTALVGLILVVPIISVSFGKEALTRFRGTNVFNAGVHWEEFAKQQRALDQAVRENNTLSIISNKGKQKFLPLRLFLENYTAHFRPSWLFAGSPDPHKIPSTGLLFWWTAPFLLLGFILLFDKNQIDKRASRLIFFWILTGILPSAITTDAPHAMRAYNILPAWQILTAMGLIYFFNKFQKYIGTSLLLLAGLVFFSLFSLYQNYFFVFPKEQSASFQYPLGQAIPYVLEESPKYDKVVFSNQNNLYQSYMFFLFYSRYDPKLYQSFGGTFSGGFAETHQIGKYEFRPIEWLKETKNKTLFVENLNNSPVGNGPKETFSLLNGQEVIGVYTLH